MNVEIAKQCLSRRRLAVQDILQDRGLDLLLLSDRKTTQWLGFRQSPFVLVEAEGVTGSNHNDVRAWIKLNEPNRVGYDSALAFRDGHSFDSNGTISWLNCQPLIGGKRSQKDWLELAVMQLNYSVISEATELALQDLEVGHREETVLYGVSSRVRSAVGQFQWAFDPSVASGHRTCLAWAGVADQAVAEGPVSIDFGIDLKGYCSDYASSFWLGRTRGNDWSLWRDLEQKAEEFMELVSERLVAGSRVSDVAAFAKRSLKSLGLEQNMPTIAGHGVGAGYHEVPFLVEESDEIIMPGNVINIEPFFVLEHFGYRKERPYLVRSSGPAQDLLLANVRQETDPC